MTGIISPDRQKFFSFAQDRKQGNQKHRLTQEIPCLCRQLAHCLGQYYRQNICIAFCKRRRNFRFFCSVNHLSGALRQQMFISKSSKGHALYFVIGGFRSAFISRIVTCVRPVSGNYRLVCCGSDLSYEMQCCQLSRINRATPDFKLYLPVSRLESHISRIIAKVAISCRLDFPTINFQIFCVD